MVSQCSLKNLSDLLNHETYLGLIFEFASSLELVQTLTYLSKFHHQYLHSKPHSNALIKRILQREFGITITSLEFPKSLISNPLSLVRRMSNFWDDSATGNQGDFMYRITNHQNGWTFYALRHFLEKLSSKNSISVDLMSFDRLSQRVSVLRDHHEHILFLLFDQMLQSLYSNESSVETEEGDMQISEWTKWDSEETEPQNEPWTLLHSSTLNSSLYRNVKPTEERLRRYAPKMEKFMELLHWMVMHHEYEFEADDLWTFYYFYPFCCQRIKDLMLEILIHQLDAVPISNLFYPLQSVVDRQLSNGELSNDNSPRIWPKWCRIHTDYLIPDLLQYAVRSAQLPDKERQYQQRVMMDIVVQIGDLIGTTKLLDLFHSMLCDENIDANNWMYYEAVLFFIAELAELNDIDLQPTDSCEPRSGCQHHIVHQVMYIVYARCTRY